MAMTAGECSVFLRDRLAKSYRLFTVRYPLAPGWLTRTGSLAATSCPINVASRSAPPATVHAEGTSPKRTKTHRGLCGNQISGAPRHRRDIFSVAASARWRENSRQPNSLVDFHTALDGDEQQRGHRLETFRCGSVLRRPLVYCEHDVHVHVCEDEQ